MKKQQDIETDQEAQEILDRQENQETQLPTIYFVAIIALTCFAVCMF